MPPDHRVKLVAHVPVQQEFLGRGTSKRLARRQAAAAALKMALGNPDDGRLADHPFEVR